LNYISNLFEYTREMSAPADINKVNMNKSNLATNSAIVQTATGGKPAVVPTDAKAARARE
jgi:hypothetical protein